MFFKICFMAIFSGFRHVRTQRNNEADILGDNQEKHKHLQAQWLYNFCRLRKNGSSTRREKRSKGRQ